MSVCCVASPSSDFDPDSHMFGEVRCSVIKKDRPGVENFTVSR